MDALVMVDALFERDCEGELVVEWLAIEAVGGAEAVEGALARGSGVVETVREGWALRSGVSDTRGLPLADREYGGDALDDGERDSVEVCDGVGATMHVTPFVLGARLLAAHAGLTPN